MSKISTACRAVSAVNGLNRALCDAVNGGAPYKGAPVTARQLKRKEGKETIMVTCKIMHVEGARL